VAARRDAQHIVGAVLRDPVVHHDAAGIFSQAQRLIHVKDDSGLFSLIQFYLQQPAFAGIFCDIYYNLKKTSSTL
jgi:hypothetical protein